MAVLEAKDAVASLYSHVHDVPTPLREVSPEIPESLAAVVERALEKSPQDRFSSAEEFATELARAANAAFGPRWLRDVSFVVKPGNQVFEAASAASPANGPAERASRGFRESVVVADVDGFERTKRGGLRLTTTEAYRQRSMTPLLPPSPGLETTFDPTPPPAPDSWSRPMAPPAWSAEHRNPRLAGQ